MLRCFQIFVLSMFFGSVFKLKRTTEKRHDNVEKRFSDLRRLIPFFYIRRLRLVTHLLRPMGMV